MNILGPVTFPPRRARAWALANGATAKFAELSKDYWRLGPDRGVRPDVAYAQAAHETGFGRYGGAVTAAHHNLCGLKVTRPMGEGPEDHQTFATWEQGVVAHLDHLALYAGALGYPNPGSPDPRHFLALFATALTVVELGEKWAPSSSYGERVMRLAQEMRRFVEP